MRTLNKKILAIYITSIFLFGGLSFFDFTPTVSATDYTHLTWCVQAFTSGSGTWTVPSGVTQIDILVVGGGGGSGSGTTNMNSDGGGGGAGGLVWIRNVTSLGGTAVSEGNSFSYSVGTGGAASGGSAYGANGIKSTFGNLTAWGGGGGGDYTSAYVNGRTGGSGGGGGTGNSDGSGGGTNQTSTSGWSGTYGFGYAGATTVGWTNGGGGGGATGAGTTSSTSPGGAGKNLSAYFGMSYGISGVFSKGGNGGTASTPAATVANTGNGGNAAIQSGTIGYAGASGIILLRWQPTITPHTYTDGSMKVWHIYALEGYSGTWKVPEGVIKIDVLVVAGGGGAGSAAATSGFHGGGGGGGGLVWARNISKIGSTEINGGNTISYSVGAAGIRSTTSGLDRGTSGGDSTFGNLTAKGGGAGGTSYSTYRAGVNGGSGGGAGVAATSTASGGTSTQSSVGGWSSTYGFGYAGAASTSSGNPGAGGGAGSAASGGTVGSGKNMSSYFGTDFGVSGVFARGGAVKSTLGNETANSGNGGNANTSNGMGGDGGSGIILIRWCDWAAQGHTWGIHSLTLSSGTWTVPDGVTKMDVLVVGGGGASGMAQTTGYGGNGGGGAGGLIWKQNITNFSGIKFETSTSTGLVRLVYGTIWDAQTFTIGSVGVNCGHNITSVKLLIARVGSPGTITVSIRATSGGLPTGSDLTSGSINGNTLSTSATWVEIPLTSYELSKSTAYAIVVRATSGDASNYVSWTRSSSSTYAGGQMCESSDSGASFTGSSSYDFAFEEYGTVFIIPGHEIPYRVGAGGIGATTTNAKGTNGGNSIFGNMTAIGGGAGGAGSGTSATKTGSNGGSAGGGAYNAGPGGTSNQSSTTGWSKLFGNGFNGGVSSGNNGGGGGGAGEAGNTDASWYGGDGKNMSSYFGNSYGENGWFAGGGGGGRDGTAAPIGGDGGGGNGAKYGTSYAEAGQANTGGGAGGQYAASSQNGMAGGSGVILIRWRLDQEVTVTTNTTTGIGANNATLWGYLDSDGGENCTVRFQYGTTTNYGTNTTNQTGKGTGENFSAGVSGLSEGTVYHYRAYANNTGSSDTGDDMTFLTQPDPPDDTSSQANSSSVIYLTWTKGTGANYTRIERDTNWYPLLGEGTLVYNGTGTHCEDTSISPGQRYYYALWSFTTWGILSRWSEYEDATQFCSMPGSTTSFTSQVNSTEIIYLNWVKGTGANYTRIQRSTTGYPSSISDGTNAYNNTGILLEDGGLDAGTAYYYRAFSFSTWQGTYGDGPYSKWNTTNVSAVLLTQPESLYGFTATKYTSTQINLAWTNGAGGDGAYIEYAVGSAPAPWNKGSGTMIDADGYVMGEAFPHTGLTSGSRYYYKAWTVASDDGLLSDGTTKKPFGNTSTNDETTNSIPNAPSNPLCQSQTNPTKIFSLTPTFSWTFSDDDGGDTQGGYNIRVGTTANSGDMWNTTVTSASQSVIYAGSTLSRGVTYHWSVRTNDTWAGTMGPYCGDQTFKINAIPFATLTSPADTSTGVTLTPTLGWDFTDTDSDTQSNYHVQVSKYSAFNSTVIDTNTSGTSTSYPVSSSLTNGTKYYWRVKAKDGYEWSPFTSSWYFTTTNLQVKNLTTYNSNYVPTTTFEVNQKVVIQYNVTNIVDMNNTYITIQDPLGTKQVDHSGVSSAKQNFTTDTNWNEDVANRWNPATDFYVSSPKSYQHGRNGGSGTYNNIALLKTSVLSNQTNLTAEVKWYVDYSAEDMQRILVRYKDSNNYVACYASSVYSVLGVEERIGGVRYFEETSRLFSQDTWYTMKLVLEGSTAKVYINDVLLVTKTHLATTTAGRVGIGCDSGWIYFDDFSVGYPNSRVVKAITNGYQYEFNYTIPNNVSLLGTWTITASAEQLGQTAQQQKTFDVISTAPVVLNISTFNSTFIPKTTFINGDTVIIRTWVIDKYGSAGISVCNVTIKNPASTTKIDKASMWRYSTLSNGAIYQYNYTIPHEYASDGAWNVTVRCKNNRTYSTTSYGSFIDDIGAPDITSIKTYDAYSNEKTLFNLYEKTKVLATITDVNGRGDISQANITVTSPSGIKIIENMTMTDIGDVTNGNIYQYTLDAQKGDVQGPVWTAGKYNSGLQFNGITDEVEVPNDESQKYRGVGGYTISIWAWIDPSENDNGFLVGKPWNGMGQYNYYIYYSPVSKKIFFSVGGNTSHYISTDTNSVNKSVWYFITCTMNSTSMSIYLNGTLKATSLHGITDWVPNPLYGDQNLKLMFGNLYPNEPESYYRLAGKLDDIRLFSKQLTQTEINNLYNSHTYISRGLIGYWNMDEGCGSTINSLPQEFGTYTTTIRTNDAHYTTSESSHFVVEWADTHYYHRVKLSLSENFSIDRTHELMGTSLTLPTAVCGGNNTIKVVNERGEVMPFSILKKSGTTYYIGYVANISADSDINYYIYYNLTGTAPSMYKTFADAANDNLTLRQSNYTQVYASTSSNITYGKAVTASDLTGDGKPEIIWVGRTGSGAGNKAFLGVYSTTWSNPYTCSLTKLGYVEWNQSDNHGMAFGYTVNVTDLDSDGVKEIITGGCIYNGTKNKAQLRIWNYTSGSIHLEKESIWSDTTAGDTAIYGLICFDSNNDGTKEILTAGTTGTNNARGQFAVHTYTSNGGSITHVFWNNYSLAPSTGRNWTEFYAVAAGDIYNNGGREIIVGGDTFDSSGTINAILRIYRYYSGTWHDDWTKNWFDSQLSEVFSISIGDANMDGKYEFVTSGNYFDGIRDVAQYKVWGSTGGGYPSTLTALDTNSWYTYGYSSALTTLIKDINKDGLNDIVTVGFQNDNVVDRGDYRIRRYDGTTTMTEHSELWMYEFARRSGDFFDAACISDLNNDGFYELIDTGRYALTPPAGTYLRVQSVSGVGQTVSTTSDNHGQVLFPQPPVFGAVQVNPANRTSSSIGFNFTKASDANSTVVVYKKGSYPTSATDGTIGYNGTGSQKNFTGLDAGTKYYFCFYSWRNGSGEYSKEWRQSSDYTNPGEPTDFDANNPTASSIDLDWTKGINATTTYIVRKEGGYPANITDGTFIYNDTGTDTTDSSCEYATTYYYRAWSYNVTSDYFSALYDEDTETTTSGPPVVLSNASTSVEETSATLMGYLSNDGGEACTVGFYYDTTTGGTANNVSCAGTYTTGQEFGKAISSLTKAELYYFSGWALNSNYFVKASNELKLLTKPDAPTNLDSTLDYTDTDLTWTKATGGSGETIGTRIQYTTSPYLNFDGTGDYVDCGNGASLNITQNLTVAAWINPTINNSWSQASVLTKYDAVGNYQWKIGLTDTGQLRFDVAKAAGVFLSPASGSIPKNTWSYIVGTFDGSTGYATIYINGISVSSLNSLGPFTIRPVNPKLIIGYEMLNNRYFNGSIDDVRVYSRVLNNTEISNLYHHIEPSNTNLQGWWKLDEGTGASAADSSGKGNAGTLQGTPTWVTTPTTINDGFNAYNGTLASATVSNTEDLTYSFRAWSWVKAATNDLFQWSDTHDAYNVTIPPLPPSDVNAESISSTINVTWVKTKSSHYTLLIRNESGWSNYPSSITNGTILYNGTALNYYLDTGLVEKTIYYYRLWSYNSTTHLYSTSSVTISNTTEPTSLQISITPDSLDFGVISLGDEATTTGKYFNLTNFGMECDIAIKFGNSQNWTAGTFAGLTHNIFAMNWSDDEWSSETNVNPSTGTTLKLGIAYLEHYLFDLRLLTPISSSTLDEQSWVMTFIVTAS